MGKKINETMFSLSKQYGPLMTLCFGMKTIVVVSSFSMEKEVLKTHDHVFAGRSIMAMGRAHDQDKSVMGLIEYGPRRSRVRCITTTKLFNSKRLHSLQHLRRDEVFRSMKLIFDDKGKSVNIGHMVFYTSMNLLGNMIYSNRVFDPHNLASMEFKDTIQTVMSFVPNLVDIFPFLVFLEPPRILSRMVTLL